MIYLDHAATTPLLPEVAEAMVAAMATWGNPSSVHALGRAARDQVERARDAVAASLGATSDEIVWTSGGTEANHMLIRGLAHAARAASRDAAQKGSAKPIARGRCRILSTALEHASVRGALGALSEEGFEVVDLPVDARGRVDEVLLLRHLEAHDVALVSLAVANHELGNVYPIARWAQLARSYGAFVHADAVAAWGKVDLDVRALGVDGLTVSAHKVGGPKGVGVAYVRTGVLPEPWMTGGHQERERRAGTENVLGVVGCGVAASLGVDRWRRQRGVVAALRDRLQRGLQTIDGCRIQGDLDARTPGLLNVSFSGVAGQMVLVALDLEGICVSTGSACSSGSIEPSPTILALGQSPTEAREAVRFSLGPDNTEAEIDAVVQATRVVVARIRAAS